MANIVGLALKVTGDASGFGKSLTPVDRALDKLAAQAEKATNVFTPFAEKTAAAAKAQEEFAAKFSSLADQLRDNVVGPQEYAAAFGRLTEEAKAAAAAFEEGLRVTEQLRTVEERRATELEKIEALLARGAISEETANRARDKATGSSEAAAAAAAQTLGAREKLLQDGARLTEQLASEEEKRAKATQQIDELRKAGVITEETYARAISQATGEVEKAAEAARKYQQIIEEGQRVTASVATDEERRAVELEKIEALLVSGAISEETASRAREKATGTAAAAAQAAAAAEAESQKVREKLLQEGARLTEQFASEEEKRAKTIQQIDDLLKAGVISEETYARARGQATGEAEKAAEAASKYQQVIEDGLRVTASVATEEERRAEELAKLDDLLRQGAISQETFVRASEKATGVEKERADAAASAARIIAANLSPQERYSQQMLELSGHLEAGRLSQDQFNRAAQKAKIDLDGIGKEAGKADKNIEQLNKNVNFLKNIEIGRLVFDGVRALGSAFASVQNQISGLVTSANASIDQLDDFAQRTGIGVEALQGYSLAANLAGVDTEQFGTAVQRLAVSIGKAAPGDALDKSLRAINLSVGELRALSPEQQFAAIGNAISTLPTVADRAAAAVEVFGKQGAALAPLFRAGAASIEELQARAERLGVIVDETQVNNVTSMNDAFDLVAATVQGITGQVLGNLAPAVTDVTNQFLKFVEEFAGVDGQGGTGIANAITDTLLRGAEYFAGIFDEYVEYFGGFTGALNTAGETFNRISGVLEVLSGVFKGIFNTFELSGNMIAFALGKVLEGLGSFISSDLEEFGRGLQVNADAQIQQNRAELEAAAKQVANGTTQAIFGTAAQQQEAAAGAAKTGLAALRAQIERERSPQFKIETDIEQTRDRFDSFFSGVVDQSSAVTEAMRGFEAAAASVADPLNITADEIARIKVEQDKVNRAVDQELGARRAIKDAAVAQAEADTKRIAELTKASDTQSKLAEDLAAVEREQARVQEQQQAAREAMLTSMSESDRNAAKAQADAATASLASLDQIEAKLKETQQAAKQGFSDGFTKQFEETAKSIDTAQAKAAEFGKVGVRAQLELAQAVAVLQERARAGFLNKAEYDKELARQQGFFDEVLKREQENQRLIVQVKQAANVRVEEFLKGKIDERTKFEIARQEEAAKRRQTALENVAAIEERIAVQEKSVQAARSSGDVQSARARAGELRTLRQAQVAERRIAEGRNEVARNQSAGLTRGFSQAEQFQSRVAQTNENFLQAFTGTYAAANASLNAANAVAAELTRQQELSRPVAGSVATADIRTAEGAALVLGLGAAAQDPNLIEARLQTKQLAGIRTAINNAVSGYLGTVAEIF